MTSKSSDIPVKDELDFAYLLELMPPLYCTPEFSWLPELFSIIGHERLLKLCKYAGGERIRIPTLEQVQDAIDALQWFYDVHIKKERDLVEVPLSVLPLFMKVVEIYDSREYKERNRESSKI